MYIYMHTDFTVVKCNNRLERALDLELSITRKYSGSYFYEEAQGIADGSGVDLQVEELHFYDST